MPRPKKVQTETTTTTREAMNNSGTSGRRGGGSDDIGQLEQHTLKTLKTYRYTREEVEQIRNEFGKVLDRLDRLVEDSRRA